MLLVLGLLLRAAGVPDVQGLQLTDRAGICLVWPVASLTAEHLLTLVLSAGVFVAWRWNGGLGPAYGKIAVRLGGMAPPA